MISSDMCDVFLTLHSRCVTMDTHYYKGTRLTRVWYLTLELYPCRWKHVLTRSLPFEKFSSKKQSCSDGISARESRWEENIPRILEHGGGRGESRSSERSRYSMLSITEFWQKESQMFVVKLKGKGLCSKLVFGENSLQYTPHQVSQRKGTFY